MKNIAKKTTVFMLGVFAVTPLFAMDEGTKEDNIGISSRKLKFKDNSKIRVMPNGKVKIANEGEVLEFDELNKPVFKTETGEVVIEYSGLPTDKNPERSWAIATFVPNGHSSAHFHKDRTEDYYITSENAQAHITVDGKEYELTTGDHLRILPNQVHQVLNTSQENPLSLIVKCVPSWIFSDVHSPEKK